MNPEQEKHAGKPRLLITGGAGFLGTSLASRVRDRYAVTLLDNLTRDTWRTLDQKQRAGIEFLRGDVTDRETAEMVADFDLVVHMAAIAGVSNYYEKPFEVMRVNLGGTLNLLEAAAKADTTRFVLVSTSEVYGVQAEDASEDRDISIGHYSEPRWTYALSKAAAEKAVLAWGRQFDREAVCVRPFNVYGPGQTGEGAISDMIRRAIRGEPITVHGDGSQMRAWCYVDDFIDGLVSVIQTPGLLSEVFNLGNPDAAATVMELAQEVVRAAESDSEIVIESHFGTDIQRRSPNIDKARGVLFFDPGVALSRGLAKTVEWYRKHD
jgi:UDP-glucose 4-epimerase